MKKYITNNFEETQKLGEDFARTLDSRLRGNDNRKGAIIIGLTGNLGGGKTTFLQGFAKGLGIKDKILSPTFVIMKKFSLPVIPAKAGIQISKNFYHFDCYRINKPEEILELDFKNIIKNQENIIAIEWPEKIKKVLSKEIIEIDFKFIDENKREINFKT